MLNCKEFTLLAAKMEEERQPLMVRLNFAFHKLICKNCATFVAQFKTISDKMKLEYNNYKLTDSQKAKILSKIATATNA